VYACRVESAAVDYRYVARSGESPTIAAVTPGLGVDRQPPPPGVGAGGHEGPLPPSRRVPARSRRPGLPRAPTSPSAAALSRFREPLNHAETPGILPPPA